jgi:hypothetical protein
MMTLSFNPQEFYLTQGQISDKGPYSAELAQLPDDLPALINTIQGLMVHLHWAERYDCFLTKPAKRKPISALSGTGKEREFLMMQSAFIAHQQDLLPETFFSTETS